MTAFALTNNSFTFTSSSTVPASGYDISEFANDSRGTARVADWNDFKNMDADQFDDLVSDLSLSDPFGGVVAFISWQDSTFLSSGESGNKYYRDPSTGSNVGYLLHVNRNTNQLHVQYEANDIISTSGSEKELVLTGLTQIKPILVVFTSSAQAIGDPHVQTFGGQKYTL